MEMTHRVVQYIERNALSIEKISQETGVASDVISGASSRSMNASEFLAVCSYLKVDPYDFWDER